MLRATLALLFMLALPADLKPQQTATSPGIYRMSGGVSAPTVLRKVQPEYSEEARKARIEGTVVLYVEVGANGRPRNIRVIRSLGLGLDEKAIEAVEKWEFRPGYKDGKPVTVAATIEVNFHLLDDVDHELERGMQYYYGGSGPVDFERAFRSFRSVAERRNPDAQRMLGIMYQEGLGVRQDDVLAYMWLELSAGAGDSKAREARDKLEQKMAPDQIAEGKRLAREWTPATVGK